MRKQILALLSITVAACVGASPPGNTVPPAAPPAAPPPRVGVDPGVGVALPTGYEYPSGDTVRVVTWNVEHFVDPYDDPYVNNPREDRPAEGMQRRVEGFAEVIRALDADVVVLQEFESEAYLETLAREELPEMGYRFFAGAESPTWYQNVVVMSRLPLGVLRSYANVTTPVEGSTDEEGRPEAQNLVNHRMWMVDVFARPDYTFALAALHLKAGRTPRDVGFRIGQIRFLHAELARLLAERPAANMLVAGDLNALPGSPEFILLLDPPTGVELIDPLADTQAFTHPAEAPARQLDHLLPNLHMLPELVPGSARVATPLPQAEMARVSDHLPVVAEFVAREQPGVLR